MTPETAAHQAPLSKHHFNYPGLSFLSPVDNRAISIGSSEMVMMIMTAMTVIAVMVMVMVMVMVVMMMGGRDDDNADGNED